MFSELTRVNSLAPATTNQGECSDSPLRGEVLVHTFVYEGGDCYNGPSVQAATLHEAVAELRVKMKMHEDTPHHERG